MSTPFIQIAHSMWLRADCVGAIETEVKFEEEADGKKFQRRTTVFRSIHGAELQRLSGRLAYSSDLEVTHAERQRMQALHEEAIAAVRENRDARSVDEALASRARRYAAQ